MPKLTACGVLVTKGDPIEAFLLMEHAYRLDLPKGHVDSGETEIQCALRELVEETGITADDIELDPDFRFEISYLVQSKRHGGQWCDKTVVIFWGRLLHEVRIAPTEHVGFRWVGWNPPHDIQAATIDPLLAALQQYLTPETIQ